MHLIVFFFSEIYMDSYYLLNSVEPIWLFDIRCNILKLEMRNFTS